MKSHSPSSVHGKLKPEMGKDLCKHTPINGRVRRLTSWLQLAMVLKLSSTLEILRELSPIPVPRPHPEE